MGLDEQLAFRFEPLAALVPALAVPRFANNSALAEQLVTERWGRFGQQVGEQIVSIGAIHFLYIELAWDSRFFGQRMARLQAVLYSAAQPPNALVQAAKAFEKVLAEAGIAYCHCEVAARDPTLLYALSSVGWALVESRLHYYHDALASLTAARSRVRAAQATEAEHLASVAASNRNPYDRFHADPFFGLARGDAFLGEYARAAVTGFCDVVLVPDLPMVDSFLAISYLAAEAQALDTGMGRVVLAAVGAQNKGWHRRLVAETLHHVRERQGELVFMTTQAANKAVMYNAEQLGFQLGGVTHILSKQPVLL